MYQRNVDAQLKRQQEAELYPITKQGLELDNQVAQTNIRAKQQEMFEPAVMGLDAAYKKYGQAGLMKALPVAFQMFGVPPDQQQAMMQAAQADPEGFVGMLQGLVAQDKQAKFGTSLHYAKGPDGRLHAYQVSEGGGIVEVTPGEGQDFALPLIKIDQGDRTTLADSRLGTPEQTFVQSGAPSADQSGSLVGGQVVYAPAPGSKGEADARAAEEKRQADLAAEQRGQTEKQRQADIVLERISKVKDLSKEFATTGFFSPIAKRIPGTPAYDANAAIDTIRANIGFDALQRMRDNSPTGGALGQVTEKETALLQSVMTSLDQAQSGPEFVAGLNRLERVYSDIINGSKEQQAALRKRQASPVRGGQSAPSTGGQKIIRYDANGNRL